MPPQILKVLWTEEILDASMIVTRVVVVACYSWCSKSQCHRSRSRSLSDVLAATAARQASVLLITACCSKVVRVWTILKFCCSRLSNRRLARGVSLLKIASANLPSRRHGRHRWPNWPSASHTGGVPLRNRKHLSVPFASTILKGDSMNLTVTSEVLGPLALSFRLLHRNLPKNRDFNHSFDV